MLLAISVSFIPFRFLVLLPSPPLSLGKHQFCGWRGGRWEQAREGNPWHGRSSTPVPGGGESVPFLPGSNPDLPTGSHTATKCSPAPAVSVSLSLTLRGLVVRLLGDRLSPCPSSRPPPRREHSALDAHVYKGLGTNVGR